MGKLDEKKKRKRDSLLVAAFALFTDKGINDTSISDIAKKANMAKGTFYLYFKDKFDIRDKLIVAKAGQIFRRALEEMNEVSLETLEDHVIFLVRSVVNQLEQDKTLLQFIAKNLSWGVFNKALRENDVDGDSFYHRYCMLLAESGRSFRSPDLMLYMIVELVSSTCYSVILRQEPVTLEELKPELFGTVYDIIQRQEIRHEDAVNP